MTTTTSYACGCWPPPGGLRIPSPVLTEVRYFIEREQGAGAESAFLTSIADGESELTHPDPDDLRALAERLGDYNIATLDRRHFSIVRPANRQSLTLYP
jgi:uncharacterized protein